MAKVATALVATTSMPTLDPIISVEKLSKTYASGLVALKDVDLTIRRGGSFYSIDMLPPLWQKITLLNPVVYLVSGFRWSFFDASDVSVEVSLGMTCAFLVLCLGTVRWMLMSGYRLKA